MKVALAQLNYIIGDFKGNSAKIIKNIENAKAEGADLVIFSELSVTGYYPHDLLEKKEFIVQAEKTVNKIAEYCKGIAAIVGAPYINKNEREKKLFNAAFFLADGKILSVHKKTLLPAYDIFDEYRHFEPNKDFSVIEYKNQRIAITICEDLWDNQSTTDKLYRISVRDKLAKLKPDFIVNISASPFSYNQESGRKDILISKAKKYNIPIVYVNQTGAQGELIFDGGSAFINNQGKIVKELKYFEEDFLIINKESAGEIVLQPAISYIEKIYNALILGIRDYLCKSGFSKAILGLSGGLDSAVTAVLAVRALGPENVRVLLLPSKYSPDHSVKDARQLAENLQIQYDLIEIQTAVNEFEKSLASLFNDTAQGITEENIQARTRGIYLMAVSNKFGNILLNTSNKSECAVGYGTLYGDMNGSIAVLGDLYKTDVYKLARFINKDKEIIPENTITKPPSAELRPGQKDTDSLPEYELLDRILFNYIELNLSPEEIEAKGFDKKIVEEVIKLVAISEFKRFQSAPILHISTKAFGLGRKMPLVKKY
ncbi:MAG: NAD+ synthase [Bacteroidales bacterium]|nr:NAD+ synthase [Bacteroidales bacterium]